MSDLRHAIKNGDCSAVQQILDQQQATVNQIDDDGFTPLYLASMKSASVGVVRLLLAAGAQPDLKGSDKETPLYIAVFNGVTDTIDMLLAAGAKVNEANGLDMDTALHCVARLGNCQLISHLLAASANVNVRNVRLETPIFCAAKCGRYEATYLLLQSGANKALTNNEGKDTLYAASENDHKSIAAILKADKSVLKETKSIVDVEIRNAPPRLNSTAMMHAQNDDNVTKSDDTAASKVLKMAERKHAEPAEPVAAPPAAAIEYEHVEVTPMVAIDVPQPAPRTHDPLTGEALPPCKTLYEAGVYQVPPAPEGVNNDFPERSESYGGTAMYIGQGTEEKVKQRPMFSPESGDVFDTVVLPKQK
jgi:hypothetical protein